MFNHPEIWILAAGVFLGFFTQTIVGFAAALVSFPFLLTQYNLQEATAFLAFYYVIFSLVLVYKNYRDIDRGVFKDLAVVAGLGYLMGFFVLKTVNPLWLERALGLFLIIYCLYEWRFKRIVTMQKQFMQFMGLIGGIIGGVFTSGSVLLGPLVSSRIKNGVALRATLLALFAIANFLRFPFVVATGLLTRKIFMESLLIFPVFIMALYFGHLTYKRISEQFLRNLILLFLIISGISFLLK